MKAVKEVRIGERIIGGQPCFVIAEAGVNHNGDPKLARRLVEVAAEAGADAVKFQTFNAAQLVSAGSPKAAYQKASTDPSESQFEMLRRLELPRSFYPELLDLCRRLNILFLSTAFDEESADFLDALPMEAFKIPSGEVTNLHLLEHIARKGKPMIVSTGMCSLSEVKQAVEIIENAGNDGLVLLHCVSCYPASAADANIRAMATLSEHFHVPIGYSDHVLTNEVAFAAVALGASVIEKHFTTDRRLSGPDHQASLEPDELKSLVTGIRRVEASLGDGRKVAVAAEQETAAIARRSLVAACDIPAGTTLTNNLVTVKRPGTGLPPSMEPMLLGRTARQHIPAGTLLSLEMFA